MMAATTSDLPPELQAAQERLERRKAAAGIKPAPHRPLNIAPAQSSAQEDDDEDLYALLLPDEGEYRMVYHRCERGEVVYGSEARVVLFATFKLTDAPHTGRSLIRYYNAPRGPRLPRSSSLYRDFLEVTGRRPPSRPFSLSWAFGDCEILARVKTVKDRPARGGRIPMKPVEFYSKVDALLRIVSGRPPVLRGVRFQPLAVPQKKRKKSESESEQLHEQ